MILLLALVVAVGWALVRGGNLSHLQAISLRRVELALAAFGIQVAVIYLPLVEWSSWLRVSLLALSYVLLVGFVWSNRQLPGIWLLASGLAANWLVILANGGYMPITYEALVGAGRGYLAANTDAGSVIMGSKDILLPMAETRLWFLSDIFVIPPPFPLSTAFSLGDGLVMLGLFRFVTTALGVPSGGAKSNTASSV